MHLRDTAVCKKVGSDMHTTLLGSLIASVQTVVCMHACLAQ
jgi:hypothetical protein